MPPRLRAAAKAVPAAEAGEELTADGENAHYFSGADVKAQIRVAGVSMLDDSAQDLEAGGLLRHGGEKDKGGGGQRRAAQEETQHHDAQFVGRSTTGPGKYSGTCRSPETDESTSATHLA